MMKIKELFSRAEDFEINAPFAIGCYDENKKDAETIYRSWKDCEIDDNFLEKDISYMTMRKEDGINHIYFETILKENDDGN